MNEHGDIKREISTDGSEDTETDEAKPAVLPDPSLDLVGESETSSVPSSPPWFTVPASAQPESGHVLTIPPKAEPPGNQKTPSTLSRSIQRTAIPPPISSQPRSRVASARATREPSASFTEFKPLKDQVAKVAEKPKSQSTAKVLESSSKAKPKTLKVAKEKPAVPRTQNKSFDPRTTDFMKLVKGKGKSKAKGPAQSDDEESGDETDGSSGSSSSGGSSSDSNNDSESESDDD